MKRYYFFIGTVAELIKLYPVIKEFQDNGVDFKIIATGQNNIKNTEFTNFLNKEPDIVLSDGIEMKRAINLFLWFFKTLFHGVNVLKKEFKNLNKKETFFIVHGDTVSTVMGAIISKFFGFRVIHVEAGLRSFNFLRPFPEEIDRVLTSFFVNIAFCPNDWALNNLKNKRYYKVDTKNNTVVESLDLALKFNVSNDLKKSLEGKKYFIFVVHRQENIFDHDFFSGLIKRVIEISKNMTCIFILHEPTKQALEDFGLLNTVLNDKNIICVDRLNYLSMVDLLNNSEFVLGDGGSQQEEAYYLGKPYCILRNETERIEGLGKNAIISKRDFGVIDDFVLNYKNYIIERVIPSVEPSKIIFDYLNNYGE